EAPLNARLGAVLRVPFEPTRDDVLATALLFLFDGLYAVPGGGAPTPAAPFSAEEQLLVKYLYTDALAAAADAGLAARDVGRTLAFWSADEAVHERLSRRAPLAADAR